MNYTKYEVARLVGARALQIKMGAPVLISVPKEMERPIDIARLELKEEVLPITIRAKEDRKKKHIKAIAEIPFDEEEGEEGVVAVPEEGAGEEIEKEAPAEEEFVEIIPDTSEESD